MTLGTEGHPVYEVGVLHFLLIVLKRNRTVYRKLLKNTIHGLNDYIDITKKNRKKKIIIV